MTKTIGITATTIAASLMMLSSIASATDNAKTAECIPLPENGFFSELMGITFSPEQAVAYDDLEKQVSKLAEERFKDVEQREMRNSPPNLEMRPDVPDSDRIAADILNEMDRLNAEGAKPDQQIKQLTEKFGKSAVFNYPRASMMTTEQLQRREQFQREIEDQFRRILTPDQRKVYESNLVRRGQIEACEKGIRYHTV